MHSRPALAVSLALALAVAGVAAGCGGNSPSQSVASLGSSGTTTASGADGAGSGGGSAPSTSSHAGDGFGLVMKTQNGAKFSACMRSHGVPNFPDPSPQGEIQIGPGSGVDPRSAKFQSAQSACRSVLPNGGRPSPQQVEKMQHQALAFSACMRSHGVPDFPDPSFSGGGVTMKLKGGKGSDLNPQSPAFRAAQTACQGKLPGKIAAGVGGGGK